MTEQDFLNIGDEICYFFTYYGDVYCGMMVKSMDTDNYYIIPRINCNDYRSNKNVNDEFLKKIGFEIKDLKIVTRFKESIQFDESGIQSIPYRFKSKKLFVFGAGASAYCSFNPYEEKDRERLPLGNELFTEKYCDSVYYKGVQKIVPFFEARNIDVETFLEDYLTGIQSNYDILTLRDLINVQYYVHDTIKRYTSIVSNNTSRYNAYSVFATCLRKYLLKYPNILVSIVSFNYDTLLDESLEREFDYRFNNVEDYVNPKNSFWYFKPHGSINWGWKITNEYLLKRNQEQFIQYLYDEKVDLSTIYYDFLDCKQGNLKSKEYGVGYLINKKAKFSVNKDAITILKDGEVFYPAMLLPYRDKDEFVMPYSQQLSMRDAFNQIEDLYLIGWKGNEKLFKEYCRFPKLKKIVVVNPDVQSVLENVSGNFEFEGIEFYKSFGDFVRNIAQKDCF